MAASDSAEVPHFAVRVGFQHRLAGQQVAGCKHCQRRLIQSAEDGPIGVSPMSHHHLDLKDSELASPFGVRGAKSSRTLLPLAPLPLRSGRVADWIEQPRIALLDRLRSALGHQTLRVRRKPEQGSAAAHACTTDKSRCRLRPHKQKSASASLAPIRIAAP